MLCKALIASEQSEKFREEPQGRLKDRRLKHYGKKPEQVGFLNPEK